MGTLALLLRQMVRDLWSQKLRTFLTTFGIVWGTVAVSLLLAFGEGLHERQTKSFAGLGDRIVIAWPSRTSLPYEGLGKGRRIRMTEDDVQFVRDRVDGIAALSSEYSETLQVRYGERGRAVDVSGISPEFGTMRALVPQRGGRFINPIDMEQRRRVVFVGNELAEDLLGPPNPVGETVMLHGSPFTVVGVLTPKTQDSSYSGRDHSKMFIPAPTLRALTGRKHINLFIFRAQDPAGNAALTERIRQRLAERMRFDPADTEALSIWDTTEMFVFFDTFMLGFKIFLGLMGGLTLVVGGIGVSNIMNVVVEERTREIGIKMALGARYRTVLAQFLAETMLITAVGGAVGLALAFAICAAVPAFGLTEAIGEPHLSPALTGLTAVVLGLIGLVAGYFPARDAAGMDPVVAMKL